MREFFHAIKRDSVLVSANADFKTTKPSYGFLTQHRLNAVLPVLPSRPHLLSDHIFSNKARPIQHPDSFEITLEMMKHDRASSPTAMETDIPEPYQKIIKFTHCDVLRNGKIIKDETLWVRGGKIVDPAALFYGAEHGPDEVIDFKGKKTLIAPGFLDLQINGFFGYDFADIPNIETSLEVVSKGLLKYGVTSFCPTLVSSPAEVYHGVLPKIAARKGKKSGHAEVLGAHIEGPFLSSQKKGAHDVDVLRSAPNGYADFIDCYGPTLEEPDSAIAIITVAPELEGLHACIKELKQRSKIVVSLGHTKSNYKDAEAAVAAGASMITHLFNAMEPFHHRDPGPVGLIGSSLQNCPVDKPFYGIITDGVHADPSSVRIAYVAHPEGCVLVTDAISAAGVDGEIFTLGTMTVRRKSEVEVVIDGTETIAGSVVTMPTCIKNLVRFTGCTLAQAINAATLHAAKCIGLEHRKGTLMPGTDADFVILDGFDEKDPSVFNIASVYVNGEKVEF
ncbi:Metallo-dependent hydrolase [Rhizoclosmatium globosum]|uniref:N-acetylglucosamine-6-phosphate deacetylase n=1 Tax=Rhizoclosmatium globosum TaxID=329046 RepID=A0A1Y2CTZ1_9FUNG|nr:Metallo-dependent hydrolase [Rhizoclosmatium globosum]|eukprot:ORY50493.1 Metallo-dependent hydrolase [Rhizoclosmatium globosum]